MPSCPSRCTACNSIIAKTDIECYVCREPVAGRKRRWFWSKPDTSLRDRVTGQDMVRGSRVATAVLDR